MCGGLLLFVVEISIFHRLIESIVRVYFHNIAFQSNRIVEEQRLLPLKEAGLTSASLPSPSRLDDRMRIDAALPTKDCPPTGHLQAQAAADQLDRDIVEHIKENFAPSSFLESEDMTQYRDEIEQDKKQDPHQRLLDMLASTGVAKDATRMARPPCTLISQIGNKSNGDDGANPAISDIPPNDYSYLPTLIRKDPPLPGAEDRQQQPSPPQTHLPSAMSTIKSILPSHAQMPSMRTVRSKDADSMDDEQPPRSLEDIVSKARVIDGRSVGQIMLGSRSHDQGGILIPQQPFPSAAASNGLGSEMTGARQKSTAEEDADLAASVRSFLSKTREADRFVAGSSLSMKANDYECRSWFVDRNNPLPEYGENQALDAEEVRTIFQDRAFCRNREEGAREMVLTGAKMKRERGCCTYRGFLTSKSFSLWRWSNIIFLFSPPTLLTFTLPGLLLAFPLLLLLLSFATLGLGLGRSLHAGAVLRFQRLGMLHFMAHHIGGWLQNSAAALGLCADVSGRLCTRDSTGTRSGRVRSSPGLWREGKPRGSIGTTSSSDHRHFFPIGLFFLCNFCGLVLKVAELSADTNALFSKLLDRAEGAKDGTSRWH